MIEWNPAWYREISSASSRNLFNLFAIIMSHILAIVLVRVIGRKLSDLNLLFLDLGIIWDELVPNWWNIT